MASEDETRRELFDLLEAGIGGRGAALLMTYLPPTGWADLVTRADLTALSAELRGEMAGLRAELRGEMSELRGDMVGLRGEMSELRGDMAGLRGEMIGLRAELKGEIAELRGEMRSQLPKLYAANIAAMIGIAGLVLAAGALT